jgi:hypothetical protein
MYASFLCCKLNSWIFPRLSGLTRGSIGREVRGGKYCLYVEVPKQRVIFIGSEQEVLSCGVHPPENCDSDKQNR